MRNNPLVFRCLLVAIFSSALWHANAQQSVSIGTTIIDRDAVLFLLGDGSQGLIIPKTTDLTNMPKKPGMVVYNETDGQVYSCDGNLWTALGGGNASNPPVLQINGNNFSIFAGTDVGLASTPPTTRGQLLMWDGSRWTVTSTIDPITGSVLVWNGSRWEASTNIVTDVTGTAPITVNPISTTTRNVSILPSGITTPLLADGAVNSAKIQDGTIAAADLSSMGATSGQMLSFNGTAWAPATNPGGLSNTLNAANIFVGNASNVATGVALSGDATLSNAGVITLTNGAVAGGTGGKILDGSITAADLNSMSATTGQVLKFNGTNWAPSTDDVGGGATPTLSNGQLLIGNGTTNSAATLSGDATLSGGVLTIGSGVINSAKILDGTVSAVDLNAMGATAGQVLTYNGTAWAPAAGGGLSSTLNSSNIFVGNAGNVATGVAMSGDATISNAGVLTIAAGAISGGTAGDITDASITAADLAVGAVDLSTTDVTGTLPLTLGGTGATTAAAARTNLGALSTTLTSTNIFVGNASNVATGVAMSGDATISNTGLVTIGNNAIGSAEIIDASIVAADINAMSATNGQVLKFNGTNWVPSADDVGGGATPTLSNGQILIGNGTTNSAAALSGDATLSAGVITIGSGAITSAKILDGTIAAVDLNAMGATTGQVLTYNGTNWAPAAGGGGLSSTLNSANIFVGNASNVATGVALSGDATISNSGAITLNNSTATRTNLGLGSLSTLSTITTTEITNGTIAGVDLANSSVSGGTGGVITDASITAADLAVGAVDLTTTDVTGTLPLTQGGTGATTATAARTNLGLGTLATLNAVGTTEITDGSVTNIKVANVGLGKLLQGGATTGQILKWDGTAWSPAADDVGGGATPTLSNGQLLIGNGTTNSAAALSGDATLSAGVITIGSGAITSAKILDGTIAAVDLNAMGATTGQVLTYNGTNWAPAAGGGGLSSTLNSANIFVGNASNVATGVALSGDATISNSGAITLNNSTATRTNLGLGSLATLSTISTTEITNGTIAGVDLANSSVSGGTGGVITDASITAADLAVGAVDLTTTDVTGTLPLTQGGTGASTATAARTNLGLGALATLNAVGTTEITDGSVTNVKVVNVGLGKLLQGGATTGQILKWDGTAWSPAADDVGGGATPTLSNGQLLIGNGTTNSAAALSGDATLSAGVITIGSGAINSTKILDGTIAAVDLNAMGATTGQVLTYNGTNWAPAAGGGGLSSALNSANIFVGNASNVATGVALSGDATISNSGAITLNNSTATRTNLGLGSLATLSTITTAEILNGTIAGVDLANSSVSGGAGGVITDGSITAADLGTGAVDLASPDVTGTLPLTQGGTGATTATAARTNLGLGALATLNAVGTTEITDGSVTNVKVANVGLGKLLQGGATTGQILKWDGTAWSPAADDVGGGVTPTLSNGQILIGNGTTNSAAALSGDATLSAGVITIGTGAITSAKILDGTIAAVDLANGSVSGGTGGVISDASITAADLAVGAVDLTTTDVTGTLPITLGGTGATTAAAARTSLGALSTTLTNANIFVGSAGNLATGVTMSGDATISNTGAVTIGSGAINSVKILDGTIAAVDLNAMGATASQVLQYNGTNWAPATIGAGVTTLDGLTDVTVTTPSSGQLLVHNGAGQFANVAVSGDATLDNAGVLTIANNAVTNAKISNVGLGKLLQGGATTGQVLKWDGTAWSPAVDAGLSTALNSTQILVGNASNVATAVTMSGDATISNTGVVTIATGAVNSAKVLDGSIVAADLANGSVSGGAAGVITDASITSADLAAGSVSGGLGGIIADGTINGADIATMGATNGQVLTFNGSIWAPAAALTSTLASANIFVGNGSNVATAVAMSGDGTLSNSGVLTLSAGAVSGGTAGDITDATITNADISASAAIAGTKISPAFGIQNISTSGSLTTSNSTTFGAATLTWPGANAAGVLSNNGTGTLSWVSALTTSLASANLYVGNASNQATAVAMSGDATLTNAGVLTIANNAIGSAEITDGTIASADIADGTITTADLATGAVTASNGLTATSNNVALGGTLTSATSIAMGANNLTFTGTGNLIFSGGNFGVGVAPTAKFNVFQNLASATPMANVENGNAGGDGSLRLSGGSTHYTIGSDASANAFVISNSSTGLGTSDRLAISSAGNIGLGTSTPASRLDVEGGVAIGSAYSGTTAAPTNGLVVEGNVGIGSANASNPPTKVMIVDSAEPTLRLTSSNTAPLTNITNSGTIEMLEGNGTFGSTANGFRLRYDGNANTFSITSGVSAAVTDHLIIDRGSNRIGIGRNPTTNPLEVEGNMYVNGNIGILTTTPSHDLTIKQSSNSNSSPNGVAVVSATTSNYWKYHTSGTLLRFSYWDGTALSSPISYTDGNADWTISSDRRLKEAFEPVGSVLESVMKLNPMRYYYKRNKNSTGKLYGFIAQEMESVFPALVSPPNSESEYYGLNYENLHAISIKAIQEQQALITKQQAEIELLKAKLGELDSFKAELEKLKEMVGAETKKTGKD